MRCLITGANGFLGAHLARALCARGDTVRCMVREGSDASALAGVAVERVVSDVTRPDTLADAVKNVEVVFHLAGIRRATQRAAFIEANAEGTRHVAEAMVKAGARRLVNCGSLAASGPSTARRPRVEDDPFSPEEPYGESKALGEQIAFSFSDRLEVTSIRPARILGPLDHENLSFFKIANRGFILKIGGGPRPLSMVDVDDVVAQLLLQADLPQAVGQAFFSSSDETITLEGVMELAAAALEVKNPRHLYLPAAALAMLGAGADVVSRLTATKLPLNRKLARQLLVPGWTCSIEKAKRLLGYQPRRTISESIARSAKSYVEAEWL
ncbi:MAG: NAD-dependent epimerase/dehydratase family protein [Archangiaceae bacterium]|nr:NAD-dependent epimerase/dehydratase family protein [Archangiaceae bacterium]